MLSVGYLVTIVLLAILLLLHAHFQSWITAVIAIFGFPMLVFSTLSITLERDISYYKKTKQQHYIDHSAAMGVAATTAMSFIPSILVVWVVTKFDFLFVFLTLLIVSGLTIWFSPFRKG